MLRLQSSAPLLSGVALLLGTVSAPGQGTFQNLGFESATLVPVPGQPPFYYFTQAFPGWTGYVGGVQQGLAVYNQLAMSTAGFSIIDSVYRPLEQPAYGGLIEGSYTAVLMSGAAGVNQTAAATFAQTGLVPAGTESLQFRAQLGAHNPLASFDVTLGGQTLSLVSIGSGTNYTLFGADVHAFAGETAELDFIVNTYPNQFAAQYLFLDSIEFSAEAIPEPGVLALFGLGAWLLGRRVLRR
jgi:hypothetical protein